MLTPPRHRFARNPINALSHTPSPLARQTRKVFAPNGVLAQHIKGFSARQSQCDMAQLVSDAIENQGNALLEAGTGVGKTYAYLVPAILSNKQIIISTGSKNLQEQLVLKDIPALLSMLGSQVSVALLKGRNNYLCQWRLAQQMQSVTHVDSQVVDDVLKINQWASLSPDGDLGGLTSVGEHSPAIPLVASSQETCIGQACDFFAACFTRKARIRALDAQIIVVNHHLFFADSVLKETGFAELLPSPDVVIFDEAHLLPDIGVHYFGQQLTSRTITALLTQIMHIYQTELHDTGQLGQFNQCCQAQLNEFIAQVMTSDTHDWRKMLSDKALAGAAWGLVSALTALQQLLDAHQGRSEALDEAAISLNTLRQKFTLFIECSDPQAAYSAQASSHTVMLRLSPININRHCQQLFTPDISWIFTSATLQVARSLDHFAAELGMKGAQQHILDSPFDYPRQALLCVPRQLSSVRVQQQAIKQLVDVCVQAINAAQGRTFVLFTSHQRLMQAASALQHRTSYPVLVQGQAGKHVLLKKFRQLGNAVLLGTSSFWEGIDVRGKLLSCVIIDKLPFGSPDDPLYRARADYVSRQGRDPFTDIALPKAILALKQGVGRLIRDEKDRGVLILCDNRIVNRPYGQAFLHSLPPMARTRDLDRALAFLRRIP